MTTLQLVISRTPDGGFKVNEMGLNEAGQGETLRTHALDQTISAEMATRYLVNLLNDLVAVENKQ
jgi:hypothetical protein